ncbi:MAG: biotin/lipoyl-binding protein [Planctomycetes bacterium]|nr:biotin/lipoyl-binding protein [Planctomycetota bacterium]
MKYFVKVREREFEVSLEDRAGEVFAMIRRLDGSGSPVEGETARERRVSYAEVDGLGQYSILDGTRSWAASIEAARGSNSEFNVGLAGENFPISIENERERAAHAAERRVATGPRTVTAAMPGIVISVLVREGDAVEKDAAILILEAMKMQNEVRTESAGIVKKLLVEPGKTVAAGHPLFIVTPQ